MKGYAHQRSTVHSRIFRPSFLAACFCLIGSTSVVVVASGSPLYHHPTEGGGDGDMEHEQARPFLRKRVPGMHPKNLHHPKGHSSFHTIDDQTTAATTSDFRAKRKLTAVETTTTTERQQVEDELSDILRRMLDEDLAGSMEGNAKPTGSDGSPSDSDSGTTADVSTIPPDSDAGTTADASTSSPTADTTTNDETTNGDVESKQPPWPHDQSDIPLDPSISYGELESNGMRYLIMSNSEPPGKLELRLHVDAGGNMELDDELGMAHFLEHMMFQTTNTFPEGNMIPTFQRLGVGFGNHVNAYTNFEETVYMLSLPATNNETLTPSFEWMRDVMGGALLLNEELESERGVVISEIEARDSVGDRLWRESMKWRVPDHLLSQRFISGTEESLRALQRQMFTDFYAQYYVPRRVTFTVVGDMDVTDMEAWIKETFDIVPDSGNRGIEQDYGSVPMEGLGLQSNVFVDNELTSPKLTIERILPIEKTPDTEARRIERIPLSIANGIVANRIQKLLDLDEGNIIVWGGASNRRWYNTVEFGSVWVQPIEGFWKESVAPLEQELRRAQLYGFTQTELDEDKANRLNYYEQQILSKDTRQTSDLADRLNDSVNGGFVFSTPEENQRIVAMALDGITADDVHEAFRAYWNTTDINIYLTINRVDGTTQEAAEALKDLYLESQLVEVTPPVEEEAVVFAYTNFGPPGTVVSDILVEDLDIRQLVLSNNIRVNMKQTGFEAHNIRMTARVGTGRLSQPKEATYLQEFADYMIAWGGLGKHTRTELDRALTGKNVGVNMNIQEDAFSFSGGSNRDDLELGLQLMAAHFSDAGFGDEAVRWWADEIPSFLDYIKYTLDGTYAYDMFGWLLGGDERFAAPTEEELIAFVADDAREWLLPALNNSYLEISLVGDLDQDETIDFLLKTFGALPERAEAPPQIPAEDRSIDTPAEKTKSFPYESKLPQAAAIVAWDIPSFVLEEVEENRKLNVLSNVFDDRMRLTIREELGGSYDPQAWFRTSNGFDYGFFFAYVEGTPEEIPVFIDSIMSIAENITTGLIDEDEFLRALLPFRTNIEDSLRDNGYWLFNVMAQCQAKPHRLDWSRNRDDFYDTLTVDEINALAQQYLTQDGAWRLSILPVSSSNTTST